MKFVNGSYTNYMFIQIYVVLFGPFHSIYKSYVVINDYAYEVDDYLGAVDSCFKACIALHSWPTQSINIYAFLQKIVYRIPIDITCAFVTKSNQVVANFIEKIKIVDTSIEVC